MANNYDKRYIANITLETVTPLKVGSSDIDMLQDSPVQKDWNGIPMILGTSIAGVLRKSFDAALAKDIFGDEESRKRDNKGSRLIISNALLCGKDMKVVETLYPGKDGFFNLFVNLPIREHTRINSRGVADSESSGKFDEEVVYKGSRFRFRMEFTGTDEDAPVWEMLLKAVNTKTFRLGGGTTKGFGDVKVLREYSAFDVFDLTDESYRQASSSLNESYGTPLPAESMESDYILYKLELTPEDFFMFGSGFGDDAAKMTPVYEKVVDYDKGDLSEEEILIPASSIKGAIAHRTAFHFNKQQLEKGAPHDKVGEENEAVRALFGEAKESSRKQKSRGSKGKLLFSDCYLPRAKEKVFDHVAIDRFTGGAIESALFNEKTVTDTGTFTVKILLKKAIDDSYVQAFESALRDITTGMLPLGGATTKGHGVFTGKVLKNGETI